MLHSDGPERRSREVTESQRALELRKFFAPQTSNSSHFNETLNDDGALDAYAETVVWRLKAAHAMVSLVDRGTQYFLAGAIRSGKTNLNDEDDLENVSTTGEWFGCSTVPTPGGLCENTLALENTDDEYPCFIINDLSKDDRFCWLPVVDGKISSYRFYAGTPITTNRGINIGSFFIFDDRVRDGLPRSQRKFLYQQASNVMKHLETKREAAERHRVALMSRGISRFLEKTSHQNDINSTSYEDEEGSQDASHQPYQPHTELSRREVSSGTDAPNPAENSVLDKIRQTLDHAADILRESLELVVGGVVFLDTASRYSENETTDAYLDKTTDIGAQVDATSREENRLQNADENKITLQPADEHSNISRHLSTESTRSSDDKHKASKVLAMSAAKIATWDPESNVLDAKTLQSLINSYPKGNVWYIDEEGYFSSLDQINALEQTIGVSPSGRRKSVSPLDLTNKKAEATMLSRIFHKARQIIFLPLWDAGGDRWYSGCFVWSQSAVPVFTVDSEIAYLSAFTNSVMVEISRLDAITSNKMKSDFISSISHEFRSPLHGILASAEFLKDSILDTSQVEFISTIQNCSATLLDTINHVLDYSKINSFEKSQNPQGTILNELYQNTNLALLCEDVVHGMIAAKEFHGITDPSLPISQNVLPQSPKEMSKDPHEPLEILLEIEKKDWDYKIQPGAFRRVIMNIFGNAQKYTMKGYIIVRLSIHDSTPEKSGNDCKEYLSLQIRDSGKGMSSEYMERKLYHPFAQEDSFAPGVGLGLSIVWSIVNQLGGKISIRSELGKGTDIEVNIPIEKINYNPAELPLESSSNGSIEARECITNVRERATGKTLSISRRKMDATRYTDVAWKNVRKYCSEWFGFLIKEGSADIIVTDYYDEPLYQGGQRVLLVHEDIACIGKRETTKQSRQIIGNVCQPLGPFKLARALLSLMQQELPRPVGEEQKLTMPSINNVGTQTPLGTPEERTVLNGIIMSDYGFSTQAVAVPVQDPGQVEDSPVEREPKPVALSPQHRPNLVTSVSGLEELSRLTLADPKARYNSQRETQQATTYASKSITETAKEFSQPLATSHSTAPPNSLRILAVDDNALNLQLLTRYLSKRKEDVIVVARNGVEAVEAVRNLEPGDTFDCIFMDISMPVMDGFEATRLIRGHEKSLMHQTSVKDVKIVVGEDAELLSGHYNRAYEENVQKRVSHSNRAYIAALTGLASRKHRDEADDSGFDDFLTKPTPFGKIGLLLKRLSEEKSHKLQGMAASLGARSAPP